jgi:hypothetical protein
MSLEGGDGPYLSVHVAALRCQEVHHARTQIVLHALGLQNLMHGARVAFILQRIAIVDDKERLRKP